MSVNDDGIMQSYVLENIAHLLHDMMIKEWLNIDCLKRVCITNGRLIIM